MTKPLTPPEVPSPPTPPAPLDPAPHAGVIEPPTPSDPPGSFTPLTPLTIARFLIGDARAIRRIWGDPWSLPVGALLLVSAALARHHDRHDLLREWHVLLHGLGASLINSMALYLLARIAWRRTLAWSWDSYWRGYAAFLGVFWMTSPMAWLYGVPYESWLAPVDATRANLWTLALVSVWRVALITRVFQVVMQIKAWQALGIVLLFANIAAAIALSLAPLPTIQFMGGLDSRPAEVQFLAGVAFQAGCITVLAAPISIIVGIVSVRKAKPAASSLPARVPSRLPLVTLAAALVVIAAWSWASWRARPALTRRDQLEALVAQQKYPEAAAFMASHQRADFPPAWSPPRKADGHEPTIIAMGLALADANAPAWTLRAYASRAGDDAIWRARNATNAIFATTTAERNQALAAEFGSPERCIQWLRVVMEHDEALPDSQKAEALVLLRKLEAK